MNIGRYIYSNIEDLPSVDAIIVTDLGDPWQVVQGLSNYFRADQIFVPELVGPVKLAKQRGSKN